MYVLYQNGALVNRRFDMLNAVGGSYKDYSNVRVFIEKRNAECAANQLNQSPFHSKLTEVRVLWLDERNLDQTVQTKLSKRFNR